MPVFYCIINIFQVVFTDIISNLVKKSHVKYFFSKVIVVIRNQLVK